MNNSIEVRVKPKTSPAPDCDAAVVGAGPYRLSAAAHLKAKGLGVRIFGEPALMAGICTSGPGLHFVGAAAAKRFGPLLYFVAGTEFAAERLAAYVSQNRVNVSV